MVLLVGLLALLASHHVVNSPMVGGSTLEQRPGAVAVDTRSGHAFVVTVGAGVPGHVSTVDIRTGAILRTAQVGLEPRALAVDQRAGRVVVVNHGSGSVSVLDSHTGSVVDTVPVGLFPHAVAVDERRGRALIVSELGGLSVLDTHRDLIVRTITVGLSAWGIAVDRATGHAVVLSQSLGRGGRIAGWLSVLDVVSGRVLRRVAVSQMPRDVALDARLGRAVVSSFGGTSVSVVDARRGLLLHTIRVGLAPAYLNMAEQTDRVYMATAAGTSVSMLDVGTGDLLPIVGATPQVGQVATATGDVPTTMQYIVAGDTELAPVAVAPRSGRVFVVRGGTLNGDGTLDGGSVLVLDAHSGAVLHTIPVGGDPVAVDVDEQAGRVLVVTEDSVSSVPKSWWEPWVQALQRQTGLTLPGGSPREATHFLPGQVIAFDLSRL
jgi:YVTN family beta-propeller protein